MDRLIELLTALLGADHALVVTLARRGADERPWAELTDEELDAAMAELRQVAGSDDTPTEIILAVADAVDELRAEDETRAAETAEERRLREEALARITPAAETAPEPETDPPAVDPAETDPPPTEDEPATTDEPEAVGVSATGAPSLDAIARRARQRRGAPAPTGTPTATALGLTAAAGLPSVSAGAPIGDWRTLGEAFAGIHRATRGPGSGVERRIPVARAAQAYPPERTLGRDPALNAERIAAVLSPQALAASGGLCAPTDVRYDQMVISTEARPIRGALPRFGADRGGVRFLPPPRLADAEGAITVWTETNDTTPADPTTKACLRFVCDEEVEVVVDAIVNCLEFGNFAARTFPERIQAFSAQAGAQHARQAEDRLWNTMCTGSLAVSAGEGLGALRDLLAQLFRAVAVYRSAERTTEDLMFRWMAPGWLPGLLATDLYRQLPGDAVWGRARQWVRESLAEVGINAVFSPDAGGQAFAPQGAGALQGWPSTVETLLFPEGTWAFVDGGLLDLGLVRDSGLNETNDFRMFSETFENVALVGVESWCLTHDLCPSGKSSGTEDFSPCDLGS